VDWLDSVEDQKTMGAGNWRQKVTGLGPMARNCKRLRFAQKKEKKKRKRKKKRRRRRRKEKKKRTEMKTSGKGKKLKKKLGGRRGGKGRR
jgi:hypothetical protein